MKNKFLLSLSVILLYTYGIFYGASCYVLGGLKGVFVGGIISFIILLLFLFMIFNAKEKEMNAHNKGGQVNTWNKKH